MTDRPNTEGEPAAPRASGWTTPKDPILRLLRYCHEKELTALDTLAAVVVFRLLCKGKKALGPTLLAWLAGCEPAHAKHILRRLSNAGILTTVYRPKGRPAVRRLANPVVSATGCRVSGATGAQALPGSGRSQNPVAPKHPTTKSRQPPRLRQAAIDRNAIDLPSMLDVPTARGNGHV